MKKVKIRQLGKLYAVMAAVCMLCMLGGTAAKAEETATADCTPTGNERAFVLSRVETGKSSREKNKHWLKIFTTTESAKCMYNIASIPDGTKKISVTFEISDYDLDSVYGAYWGYQMSGDDGSGGGWKTTDSVLDITGNGTYTMEFDAEAIIGSTVSSRGMQQLQIVITLADDAETAAAKQTAVSVTKVSCEYTKTDSDTGNAGTGDTGTGSTGNTGTGDAGTGSAGNTGSGDTGTGSTGNTGSGDAGTGSTGNTGSGDTGTGDAENTGSEDSETENDTNKKETIKTLKLTSYKKGSRKVSGKTIKKADVTVKIIYGAGTSETYTVKSDKKGKFSVKTLMTLGKNTKIKVTVKKKGYKTKKKTYKVKG